MAVVLAFCVGCSTNTAGTPRAEGRPVELRLLVDTSPELTLRDDNGEQLALGPVKLELERFVKAYADPAQHGSGYDLTLELPQDLHGKLGELTRANVGTRMAAIVDRTVLFSGAISNPILNGKLRIPYQGTPQKAKEILDVIGGERR
ncbi:SecDF P1 head subdomain-containing protein [Kibdelosporangium phytohabitans]|uniref:SecDF P1 head subdomain domain-containing protein n=1 Tax=Kibdelosporangium phytohabitans TaxID=860235 RepID=A0A0N9HYD6_9PSEU|nr:hypothetical protein [Kibdelosporangium phytohabitans]ALG08342.1 hypothetical protein AOZ06_16760 [Kibdelosporangium phytohabitans]MBE1470625.1 preprotein translocase subunit SecD [Kibdelosporangium phytohabitans]